MTPDQIDRYARHLVLKEIGGSGQNALLNARIAIVGAGGLGGPAALYLAAAGVGHITLIDDDTISLSNLQRQIQFDTADIDQLKTQQLASRIQAINPDIKTPLASTRLNTDNAADILSGHDLILDGTDNFATRFCVNDAALKLDTPLLSGAVGRFDAQVGLFVRPHACYQCFVPETPPEEAPCSEVGVLGALTGLAGSLMAMEAIKLITGAGDPLISRLWVHDGLTSESRTLKLTRDPDCPACAAYYR